LARDEVVGLTQQPFTSRDPGANPEYSHESDFGHILSTVFLETVHYRSKSKVTQDHAGIIAAVCLLSQGILPALAQPQWLQQLVQSEQPV